MSPSPLAIRLISHHELKIYNVADAVTLTGERCIITAIDALLLKMAKIRLLNNSLPCLSELDPTCHHAYTWHHN